MKASVAALAILAPTLALGACGIGVLDNYDEPTSVLSGRVVYQGHPVGVRSNGVQLELWQPGYELNQKVPVYVDQDGSFSVVIFDGDYKLNLLPGNGPWMNSTDTLHLQLNSRLEVDVPVVPYYTIEDESITYGNGTIQASFRVGQVEASRAVEFVGVYVATTRFVDRTNMATRVERPGSEIESLDSAMSVSVPLSEELAGRQDVFVRIGVKTVGVAEMLFSPIHKISL